MVRYARWSLAGVLLFASWEHAFGDSWLRELVATTRAGPLLGGTLGLLRWSVPFVEFWIALQLLLGTHGSRNSQAYCAVIFTAYAVYHAVAISTGQSGACGCLGGIGSHLGHPLMLAICAACATGAFCTWRCSEGRSRQKNSPREGLSEHLKGRSIHRQG